MRVLRNDSIQKQTKTPTVQSITVSVGKGLIHAEQSPLEFLYLLFFMLYICSISNRFLFPSLCCQVEVGAMSGSISQATMDSVDQGQSGPNSLRNLGNGHARESALQLFVQAKKRINEIFKDIGNYVVEANQFVQSEWALTCVLVVQLSL